MFEPLKNYRILIVDADVEMAQVLKSMLGEMGFTDVHLSKSGKDAITLMGTLVFDFVITEWNTQQVDGIALLEFVRHSPKSSNPTIPIIMITGRAEQIDVALARDYGVNEYIVKPFTAKSVYERIERIIEKPRGFVYAKPFIGPDRRTRTDSKVKHERRRWKITPKILQKDALKSLHENLSEPRIWLPDFSLKLKLGKNKTLDSFVTPEILQRSQEAVNSITKSSLLWIRDNLDELKALHEKLIAPHPPQNIASEISDISLTIGSRAGTFGYQRASQIAYMLYLFARNQLKTNDKNHHIVVQKHLQVLQVILGNQMSGDAGELGGKVANELKILISKYSV